MMVDISVNEQTGHLSVVDADNKVLCYDMRTFDFLGSKDIKAVAVEEVGCDEYVVYDPAAVLGKHYATRYDRDGSKRCSFLPVKFASGYMMPPSHRFYREGDNVCLFMPFTPQVYQIVGDSCQLRYEMEFEGLSYPSLDFLKGCGKRKENHVLKLRDEHYIYATRVLETSRWLAVTFNVGRDGYVALCDKIE